MADLNLKENAGIDEEQLAEATKGFSGSDLHELFRRVFLENYLSSAQVISNERLLLEVQRMQSEAQSAKSHFN